MDSRACEVVASYSCDIAENLRTKCFRCGSIVCKDCSAILRYYKGRHRICANCVEDDWTGAAQARAFDAIYGKGGWQGEVRR